MDLEFLPFLSVYDPPGSSEGSLDPLGLYLIADQLAMKLVPGVRERMLRVRFLTPITVGALVTEGLEANPHHPETPPFLVWEWLVVEAIIRTKMNHPNLWGLPGSLVVRRAVTQYNYVDHRSYLKTPRVFGFHGVYKRLAVYLGLIDTHMHICESKGLELIKNWSQDLGLGRFNHSHRLYNFWRKTVQSSLLKTPLRTMTHWTQKQWQELAEVFLPDDAKKSEKSFLKFLLLAEGNGNLGALKYIWELCDGIEEDNINEKEIHKNLKKKAPQYTAQLNAIRSYENFCRLLTDAFYSIRFMASRSDATGFRIFENTYDALFKSLCSKVPDAFHNTVDCLARVYPDMEERFKDRFSVFAEPMSAAHFAKELCSHHEKIQQDKSREGKRPWFDRMGPEVIYMRANYRVIDPPEMSDSFVHEYRTKPIFRFHRDLK